MEGAYFTSVGGKSYSGSVSEINGVYDVSVPNVPGAHASGSSIQSAENNLNIRIDELV
jgi:predicted RNase H-like HicB family nuclease